MCQPNENVIRIFHTMFTHLNAYLIIDSICMASIWWLLARNLNVNKIVISFEQCDRFEFVCNSSNAIMFYFVYYYFFSVFTLVTNVNDKID